MCSTKYQSSLQSTQHQRKKHLKVLNVGVIESTHEYNVHGAYGSNLYSFWFSFTLPLKVTGGNSSVLKKMMMSTQKVLNRLPNSLYEETL